MVMEEMPTPRETHLLIRGLYDQPGEEVTPVLPAALASIADGLSAEPAGPGALAGRSVESADGARHGEPVLADVLRHRPREDRRGLRLAGRVAVASGAARLAGDGVRAHRLGREGAAEDDRDERDLPAGLATPTSGAAAANDPENRLLARGPRVRLSAEMVRDQALAIAGLLVDKIGGPSVKPYQPEGLWNELGGGRRLRAGPRRRTCIAAASTPSGSARSRRRRWRTSTPRRARATWCRPVVDQHAAAGAGPDERRRRSSKRRGCSPSA